MLSGNARLGAFIALGIGVGVALTAGSHQIAMGVALGAAFGVAIGVLVQKRNPR